MSNNKIVNTNKTNCPYLTDIELKSTVFIYHSFFIRYFDPSLNIKIKYYPKFCHFPETKIRLCSSRLQISHTVGFFTNSSTYCNGITRNS